MTSMSDSRSPNGRTGLVARLTAGWRDLERAASLREHTRRYGGLPPIRPGRARPDLIGQVEAAGLTGRGGAGFSAGIKMRTVATRGGPAVLVANGMESEPVSGKDQALLARAPHLVLDGIEVAAAAVGATASYLCLPQTRGWLAEIVLRALDERASAGAGLPLEVHELPHRYVSSEQTSLIQWLNGREALPTVMPRPYERGVRGRPTLINNVETLAHIALIARYGAAWFREAGLADAPGTMLTTAAGAFTQPGVYEIAGGTRLGDVLATANVSTDVEAVLVGGYFGSWHPVDDIAALPFSKAGLGRAGAAPGAGVLFALPPASCGLVEAARILRYLADESAQQCGPCLFGLPAIAGDLTQLASGRPEGDPLDRLHRRFRQISGRGACRHPDGAVRMAASALSTFAADAHAHARRRPCLAARRARQYSSWESAPSALAEGSRR